MTKALLQTVGRARGPGARRPGPRHALGRPEEMVESKRRAMRAELAESLGHAARRLTFDDLVHRAHSPAQASARRSQAGSGQGEAWQTLGQVRRADAAGPQPATATPYARGKTQPPQQAAADAARKTRAGALPAQNQTQPATRRGAGR